MQFMTSLKKGTLIIFFGKLDYYQEGRQAILKMKAMSLKSIFYEKFSIWSLMKHLVWQYGAYKWDFSDNGFTCPRATS